MNQTIFDHDNFEKAYAHLICEIGVLDSLQVRQLFAQAAMYANLDNYKPTIPTNPLHEIFMAKAKGYMMREMYPEEYDHFHKQEDLEVGRLRMKLMPEHESINSELATQVYRCVHCGKKVERHSDKHWIKSYCEETGKNARLILMKYSACLGKIKDNNS